MEPPTVLVVVQVDIGLAEGPPIGLVGREEDMRLLVVVLPIAAVVGILLEVEEHRKAGLGEDIGGSSLVVGRTVVDLVGEVENGSEVDTVRTVAEEEGRRMAVDPEGSSSSG